MVELTLNAQHRSNLRWSLQVLGLSQLRPVSMGALGVAQGTALQASPGPLTTVPYGDREQPVSMTESKDTAVVEAEIAGFEAEAYGAVLGVIYYRALGDTARARWDQRMQQTIDKNRAQMEAIEDKGRASWMQARSGGQPLPAFRDSYKRLGEQMQDVEHHLDFMVALQQVKQSVFKGSRFADLQDDSVVVRTPWCQSDQEFRLTAYQMLSGQAKAPPVINRGYDEEEKKKALRDELVDAFNTILDSKISDFIDKFLELGVSFTKGALKIGLEEITNKIPIGDLIFDKIKDALAEMQMKALETQYRQDEQRRFFLKNLHWGTYQREGATSRPAGGIPSAAR